LGDSRWVEACLAYEWGWFKCQGWERPRRAGIDRVGSQNPLSVDGMRCVMGNSHLFHQRFLTADEKGDARQCTQMEPGSKPERYSLDLQAWIAEIQ
jgi:hypothetical protein